MSGIGTLIISVFLLFVVLLSFRLIHPGSREGLVILARRMPTGRHEGRHRESNPPPFHWVEVEDPPAYLAVWLLPVILTWSPSWRKVLVCPPLSSRFLDPLQDSSSIEPNDSGSNQAWAHYPHPPLTPLASGFHQDWVQGFPHTLRAPQSTDCFKKGLKTFI